MSAQTANPFVTHQEQSQTAINASAPPAHPQETLAITGLGRAIKSFQDAINGTSVRPPWVIEELLLAETATLVSAQPHSMKSLSWLGACLEAPHSKKLWGHFDAPHVESALFIETEDPEWMVEARIRGLAQGLGLRQGDNIPGFHYWCPGPFDLVAQKAALETKIREVQPSFVVLSTLQNTLHGRNMKEQSDMAPVMEAIMHIARSLCPLIVLTHSPWDKKQRRAMGTVTQTANFMTAMHYQKQVNPKTRETFAHVLLDSKAGAEDTDFHLKLTTEGDPRDPASVRSIIYGRGWPKGVGKAAILAAIEDDSSASTKEIAERTGLGERYVRAVLAKRAAAAKKVKKSKGKGVASPVCGNLVSLADVAAEVRE